MIGICFYSLMIITVGITILPFFILRQKEKNIQKAVKCTRLLQISTAKT